MAKSNRIIEETHKAVQGLRTGEIIDERRMREFGALARDKQVPQFNADSVKALRSRLNVSQAALATIINTSAATVRAWEAGWGFMQVAGDAGQEVVGGIVVNSHVAESSTYG